LLTPDGNLYSLYQINEDKILILMPGILIVLLSALAIYDGGSGKTPFCLYLAELFKASGKKVAYS
jgi:hypothetical protein